MVVTPVPDAKVSRFPSHGLAIWRRGNVVSMVLTWVLTEITSQSRPFFLTSCAVSRITQGFLDVNYISDRWYSTALYRR